MFTPIFEGHPRMHSYQYRLYQLRQDELVREAELARQIAAVRREQRKGRRFYHRWVTRLGLTLEHWGQQLERFGAVNSGQGNGHTSRRGISI